MTILLTCQCGKELKAKESLAGKRVKCPRCADIFTVPVQASHEATRNISYLFPSDDENRNYRNAWSDGNENARARTSASPISRLDANYGAGGIASPVYHQQPAAYAGMATAESHENGIKKEEAGKPVAAGGAISLSCPMCKNPFSASRADLGKVVACPACKKAVQLPDPSEICDANDTPGPRQAGLLKLLAGIGLTALGGVVTIVSYSSASSGGSFLIFYGPVLVGIPLFFTGFIQLISGKEVK
jgi:hypothetical protein